MKLNDITDNPGASQDAHARRPRHRLGQGQDRRPRRQGPDRALRRAHQGLRGRPDAAASPSAQARLQEHAVRAQLNEVNLGRIQAAIDAGKLDAGGDDRRRGAGQGRRGAPRQATACGSSATAKSRRRSLSRSSAPRNRRSPRWKRPAARSRSSLPRRRRASRRPDLGPRLGRASTISTVPRRRQDELGHDAKGLGAMVSAAEQLAANLNFVGARQGRRAEEAHLVHARRAAGLSARHLHPAARHRSERLGPDFPFPGRRHSRHVQHVRRRRHPPHGDLRAQHHALHFGLDHHPADDDRVADARTAQERGRGRAARSSTSTPAI